MNILIAILFTLSPVFPHTQADVQMLADVMWLENGHTGKTKAENRECLILTGMVVVNRAKSGEWGGDTIKEVIFAKGQYARKTRNGIGNTDTPEWVVELAEQILTYGTNVPDYVIYQSQNKNLGTRWKEIRGDISLLKGGIKMKAMVWLQRLMAVMVGIYGLLLVFSETPLSEGLWEQLKLSGGGIMLMILSVVWVRLASWEGEKFIHETR